ncbi:conserved hypothetical protein [Nitrosococcus halophilus Nc 4]|uniref:Transmembrane protein n=1 Tax=Nitrosococcus halophilus (strain Nc4) TaxID=472759 RepID=D5C3W6_NITHN|nr:hypothetical protein [Nitrosococcus halophilus]ADE15088.1 conserved hypothetical protein [Nitrosococcus halophilus Nc 4]
MMIMIVLLIGILITGMGVAVLISPARLRWLLDWFLERKNFYWVAAIRIITGGVFILAAPETRMPTLILTLGVLFIAAGITILFLGKERIDRLAAWWLTQSNSILRLWALAAMAFGGLIIWCAV